jgi:hypothetical protein
MFPLNQVLRRADLSLGMSTIFLGFSGCGRYVYSYSAEYEGAEADDVRNSRLGTPIRGRFTLHVWHYRVYEKLELCASVRLFAAPDHSAEPGTVGLWSRSVRLSIAEAEDDGGYVLVQMTPTRGADDTSARRNYMSVLPTPARLREADQRGDGIVGITHFSYLVQPPFPTFSASLCMDRRGHHLLLNCGNGFKRVALNMAPREAAAHTLYDDIDRPVARGGGAARRGGLSSPSQWVAMSMHAGVGLSESDGEDDEERTTSVIAPLPGTRGFAQGPGDTGISCCARFHDVSDADADTTMGTMTDSYVQGERTFHIESFLVLLRRALSQLHETSLVDYDARIVCEAADRSTLMLVVAEYATRRDKFRGTLVRPNVRVALILRVRTFGPGTGEAPEVIRITGPHPVTQAQAQVRFSLNRGAVRLALRTRAAMAPLAATQDGPHLLSNDAMLTSGQPVAHLVHPLLPLAITPFEMDDRDDSLA